MQILTNTAVLFASRQLNASAADASRALQRLSSGLRINSARDDAAGLAISERLTSQVRGEGQALRNAADSISALQTAEDAMGRIGESLQRMRELAVAAANATLGASDREAYQTEVTQLLSHIDHISQTTRFNGDNVFSASTISIGGDRNRRAVLDGLRLGWLEESESLVRQHYGLQADGANLAINLNFTDGAGNAAASVSGSLGADGKVYNQTLNIDMADFTPPNLPNGGNGPFYNDRIIAHEMVHAVMGRTMNFGALPTWFIEGTAELIHGADERLAADIAGSTLANVVNRVSGAWGSASIDYSSAYAATRYLHTRIKELGGTGVKDVMQYLNQHQTHNLDQALNAVTGGTYVSAAAFVADFAANGANYINTRMNLANADTGAIGGADADNGAVRTAENVLTDRGTGYGNNPLAGFTESFPVNGGATGRKSYDFQIGANLGNRITHSVTAVSTTALGIDDVNITANATVAIVHIDEAIDYLNQERASLGGALNRMDSVVRNLQVARESDEASRSRITDADYAAETAQLAKSMILQRAGVQMVSKAKGLPQLVLQLLRT
jgi:flagellin